MSHTSSILPSPFPPLLPNHRSPPQSQPQPHPLSSSHSHSAPPNPPHPPPPFHLKIEDLLSPGATRFTHLVPLQKTILHAYNIIHATLYPRTETVPPPVRSLTIILRNFEGVAHTHGHRKDEMHKQIHLSTDYLAKIGQTDQRFVEEVEGVITHEMVHCFQYNGLSTCPGGLIEGIADYIRLKANLAPPHWDKSDKGLSWDSGYQTTAYFLEHVSDTFGSELVLHINMRLRDHRYLQETFWLELIGVKVDDLWRTYMHARH